MFRSFRLIPSCTPACCALLLLAACEKQPVARKNATDDAGIRKMAQSTAEKAMPAPTLATRQLRVAAGTMKPQDKARELSDLAEKLGGTAIISATPTGEPLVLIQLPAKKVPGFCQTVTGSELLPAATPGDNDDRQIIEIIVQP